MIDLRSDTVTQPTKEMLEAMFAAKVGDDVFDEDYTINMLQDKVAKMFGKEAGLFVPSGTMSNQLAIKTHTQPGDEVICDISAHVFNFEGGGIAFHSGASIKTIEGENGIINVSQIESSINPYDIHHAQTSLVCIENTSNKGGGSCYELESMQQIQQLCNKNNLKLHLDGARIFNAIISKSYTPLQVGKLFDSISICLSKGLGAPVGSVLLGSKDFITKAKRFRKLFGGAMRQAGYLAAAGIYALDNHIVRLKDDHDNAQNLVQVLQKLNYVKNIKPTETNIVIFELEKTMDDKKFLKYLNNHNIKAVSFGKQTIRMVTHLGFKTEYIEKIEKYLKNPQVL